jgi:hypothetical protein
MDALFVIWPIPLSNAGAIHFATIAGTGQSSSEIKFFS